MLKFCGQLGFSGFLHFKRELQDYVKQRMSPNETFAATLRQARHEPQIYERIIETEKRSLDLTYSAADPENLEAFVSALPQASRAGGGGEAPAAGRFSPPPLVGSFQ